MRVGPIDLQLRTGEFFAVVGPSGCGKSTLLELLAGLSKPTRGSVQFEGRAIERGGPDGVGVVFQEDASFPWLTFTTTSRSDCNALALTRPSASAASKRRCR